jgi:hypothetical protein
MAYGKWRMAHGTWHMAHGTWHMAYGAWHMAYGACRMAHGAWRMAHGAWHTAHGVRHMAHGIWRMANDGQKLPKGEFHDQGDAKWIAIRGQLRGHNDAPCGRPAIGRAIGRLGVGSLWAYLVFLTTIN